MLSLMSFFDHQSIPESLITMENATALASELTSAHVVSDSDNSQNGHPETSVQEALEDDIDALRDYLFISFAPDGSTFECTD